MTGKKAQLKESILEASRIVTDPADREVAIIDDAFTRRLSAKLGVTLRDVYVAALKQNVWPYRYLRNRDILSRNEQLKLADAHVVVIGAGGLGGTVISLLARAGIGALTVVDSDVFDESNLNRQLISSVENIGRPKAAEAADMVTQINPAVEVQHFDENLQAANAEKLLQNADIVVDALDNVPDRLTLQATARNLGIPLVHGALAGFDGQVMTVFPGDPGLSLLYGEEPRRDDPQRPEAVLGVPAFTPSVVAAMQAMEVLKVLLNRGDLFRNRMLHIDLESGRFDIFSF